jgi:hypothetical protein
MNDPQPIFWKWNDGSVPEKSKILKKSQSPNDKNVNITHNNDNNNHQERNQREQTCMSMSERQQVVQIGFNPFLNEDYSQVIQNSNQFLLPLSSTSDKPDKNISEVRSNGNFLQ